MGQLKYKTGGEFVPFSEPALPQPTCVAYDADNFVASSTTLAWGPIDHQDGDLLVMAVMHRSALTTPSGWTLHATVEFPNLSGSQFTSILSRRMAAAGSASGTLTQASAERLVAGVLNLRGAGAPIERPDLTDVNEDKRGQFSFTVPGKGDTANLVVWALSVPFWSSSAAASPPYVDERYKPWESAPLMGRPVWGVPDGSNQPRLGMFLDRDAPAPITFTSTASNADDHVGIVAVEIPGTTA